MPDIQSVVKKLCTGKSGGVVLYHLIVLFMVLIHCMLLLLLLHGTLPNECLVSILIPIPKGSRVDVRKTQNYHAIALSSIIGKILDNIIITSQRNVIKTSDLQLGY